MLHTFKREQFFQQFQATKDRSPFFRFCAFFLVLLMSTTLLVAAVLKYKGKGQKNTISNRVLPGQQQAISQYSTPFR